jgi:transposase-like protein
VNNAGLFKVSEQRVEQDHGHAKSRTRTVLGFKNFLSAEFSITNRFITPELLPTSNLNRFRQRAAN